MTMPHDTAVEESRIKELGMDLDRLHRLKDVVRTDTEKGIYDGAVFVVARHGEIVLHEAVGSTDLENNRPAAPEDIFCIMSLTKQFVAVRTLMDIEEGRYTLTTPVKEIIPEFGIKGKQNITVKHILSHTSGLSTEIPITLPLDKLTEIEAVTTCLCNERLLHLPGSIVSYNATTAHSVLGVIVTRFDQHKRTFRQILKEDLFDPLGMADTALGLPDPLRPRIVPVSVRDQTPGLFDPGMVESLNFLLTEETEYPAGGAVSTAMDICRFAEMLRRGGELNGVRILSPETVSLATTNHTGPLTNHLMDYMREMYGWPVFPAFLGLTFFLRGKGSFPTFMGLATSPGTFGGLGAGSTCFWVDPEKELTYVFLSAGLMEEGASIMRHQRLSDMAVAAVIQ